MTIEIPGRGEDAAEAIVRKTIHDVSATRSETVVHNRTVVRERIDIAMDDGLKKAEDERYSILASAIMDVLSLDIEKRNSLRFDKQALCDWLNQYAKSLVAGVVLGRREGIIITATQLKIALAKLPINELKKIEEAVEVIFPKSIPRPESL